MDADPGEGTSDGRIKRKPKGKHCSSDTDITIKTEVKEEPANYSEFHEYSRLPSTIDTNDFIEWESGSDDTSDSENDIDCVKKEIKIECKEEKAEKSKKDSDAKQNEEANGITNHGTPSTSPNRKGRQCSLNGKDKGRNRILTTRRNMANAMKESRAKPKKVHKCQYCDYTTSNKSNLTKHILTHTGEKPFECEICQKSFAQKTTLKSHKKTHVAQFPFHCSKCRCGFTEESEKINHENKCKQRQYNCYMCKYSARDLGDLKTHMRYIHTGEKPFGCSVCSKRFTRQQQLNTHLRVHVKQLPFDCSKCGQRFADENEKQKHEKRCKCRQFECHLCSYKCFNKTNLRQHIQLKHTGEKRFKCAICGKKCIHKGDLNRHLAIHAKQRPVNCSKCLRRFTDEGKKMTHEGQCNRRHYECYLCKVKHQKLCKSKNHMNEHHVKDFLL